MGRRRRSNPGHCRTVPAPTPPLTVAWQRRRRRRRRLAAHSTAAPILPTAGTVTSALRSGPIVILPPPPLPIDSKPSNPSLNRFLHRICCYHCHRFSAPFYHPRPSCKSFHVPIYRSPLPPSLSALLQLTCLLLASSPTPSAADNSTTTTTTSSSGFNWKGAALIAGMATVGGLLFLIMLAILIHYIRRSRGYKASENSDKTEAAGAQAAPEPSEAEAAARAHEEAPPEPPPHPPVPPEAVPERIPSRPGTAASQRQGRPASQAGRPQGERPGTGRVGGWMNPAPGPEGAPVPADRTPVTPLRNPHPGNHRGPRHMAGMGYPPGYPGHMMMPMPYPMMMDPYSMYGMDPYSMYGMDPYGMSSMYGMDPYGGGGAGAGMYMDPYGMYGGMGPYGGGYSVPPFGWGPEQHQSKQGRH